MFKFHLDNYTILWQWIIKTILVVGAIVSAAAVEFLVIRLLRAHFDILNVSVFFLTAGLIALLGYLVRYIQPKHVAI